MATSSKVCSICGLVFPCTYLLLKHEQNCGQRHRDDESFVLCDRCGFNMNLPDHNVQCIAPPPLKKTRFSSPPSKFSPPPIPPTENEYLEFANKICQYCGEAFDNRTERRYHEAIHTRNLYCAICGEVFLNVLEKINHELGCKSDLVCDICGGRYASAILFEAHRPLCTTIPSINLNRNRSTDPSIRNLLATQMNENYTIPYETAFINRLASYFIQSNYTMDLPLFLNDTKKNIIRILEQSLIDHGQIKFNIVVDCLLTNILNESLETNIKVKNEVLLDRSDIDRILNCMFVKLNNELSELELKKSGWKLDIIYGLRLKINKYSPLRGGAGPVKLPKKIADRKACINVPNYENRCFYYAILAKFVTHPERRSAYETIRHRYNFSCISFPTSLHDIKTFESKNNISINVFILNDKHIVCPKKIVERELSDHRDLLLLEDGDNRHFVYIKDFNRLIGSQITKHEHRIDICKRCLWFKKVDPMSGELQNHDHLCNKNKPVAVVMPKEENKFVEFKEVEQAMRVPIVAYGDFESLLRTIQSCQPNPNDKYTLSHHNHEPISACIFLSIDPIILPYAQHLDEIFLYRGTDVVERLLNYLTHIAKEVEKIYDRNQPMLPLTIAQQDEYAAATTCYLCDKPFSSNNKKVRDHCHIVGSYRGAAHSSCNIRYQLPTFLPVFFHNLSGYDSHFIIPHLNAVDDKRISVIASNTEKYISFSKYVSNRFSIRFLDSYKFLSQSLDSLSQNLSHFSILSHYFPNPRLLELAKQKGVYPYEYMDSEARFLETQLPPMEKFYSKLRQSAIEEEEYERAKTIWKEFGCKTMGDYHDLYLKVDTLLLAEVFETFRDVTRKSHKLDPANFYTTPHMTWSSMLRMTKVKLELLTDYNMLLMVESGIRGGLVQASGRYTKANNRFTPGYDPTKDDTFIVYQDCNALYATVMTKPLPIGEFSWVDPHTISLESVHENDDYGYLLDVEVCYPDHLHGEHNDLPFLPEKLPSVGGKLVAHLGNRKNYVVHYMALKQALANGLQLIKINRAIKFRQSKWLKPYIDMNNELRKLSKNDFEKNQFKLYNNAIYGKTCEQIRNRIDVKLATSYLQAEKLIAKSNFKGSHILNENLVAIEMGKTSLLFNKAIYVGQAILDLSKTIMYNYQYQVMKIKYPGDRLKLNYMDTDSFIWTIKTRDFYKDMEGEMVGTYLDTSNYPKQHPLYSTEFAKCLGRFKDEAAGKIIYRFVACRSKMYGIEIEGQEYKRAKGIQRCVVKNQITVDDYLACILNSTISRHICTGIRSMSHNLQTVELNKISLSPHDDKRHILPNGIDTLALGHYSLRKE